MRSEGTPKEVLEERYRLESTVGSGGAGTVFKATDLETGGLVALKRIPIRSAEPGLQRRVEREIAILTRLSHPRIVRLLDHGTLPESNARFLVFEWLEGSDLASAFSDRPPTLREVLEVARQAAEGLAAAHAAGVIHRDIKPENLFLRRSLENPSSFETKMASVDLRVIDFGVAKEGWSLDHLTYAGAILGTPSYMAPEQARGASEVDGRADVFSLGVVLFELLIGELPWSAKSDLARLARLLAERAPPVAQRAPTLPPMISGLIDRMLEREPSIRMASMEGVLASLEDAQGSLSIDLLDEVLPPAEPEPPPAALSQLEGFAADSKVGAALAAAVFEQPTDPSLPPVLAGPERSDREVRDDTVFRPNSDADEPFVRGELLHRIERTIRSALAEPRAVSLAVVGPAGVGKSALRRRLAASLRASAGGPRVWEAEARTEEASISYAFVIRLLRGLGRIPTDGPVEAARDALERLVPPAERLARLWVDATPTDERGLALPESGPEKRMFTAERLADLGKSEALPGAASEEQRALARAMLADLLGITHAEIPPLRAARRTPRHYGARLRRAVEAVLRGFAERRGLVILVDEAHQLDSASATILSGFLKRAASLPVSLVGFGPRQITDRESQPAVWTTSTSFLVPPLERDLATLLIKAWCPVPVDPKAVAHLVHRAAGNPLHLEHALGAVRANGLLRPGPSGALGLSFGTEDEPLDERVPPTIAAAISMRIARLQPSLQRALTAAAVLDSTFHPPALEALLQRDPAPYLAQLVAERWIRPSEEGFELAHRAIRTVALSRVPRSERASDEARVADHLAESERASAALVARHLDLAGRSRDATARLAVAAAESLSRGDAAAARSLAEDGLDRVEDPEIEARLAETMFEAALAERDMEAAGAALERWRLADEGPVAELAAARLARLAERPAEAYAAAERAIEGLTDRVRATQAERVGALAAETLGDYDRALSGYRRLAREGDAAAALGLGRLALAEGALAAAEAYFDSALERARSTQHARAIVRALLGRAEVARVAGGLERSRSLLSEAAARAPDSDEASRVRLGRVALLPEEDRYDDCLVRLDWMETEQLPLDVRLMVGVLRGRCLRAHERLDLSEDRLEKLRQAIVSALRAARAALPALAPALEQSLALAEWLLGAPSEAAERARRAALRVEVRGALWGEELPAFDWTRARLLAASGAADSEIRSALESAVRRADEVLASLDPGARRPYLDRPVSQGLLDEARRHSLEVRRDRPRGRLILT